MKTFFNKNISSIVGMFIYLTTIILLFLTLNQARTNYWTIIKSQDAQNKEILLSQDRQNELFLKTMTEQKNILLQNNKYIELLIQQNN